MTISDSDRNLLSQALALAASRYVEFGTQAEALAGGAARLAEQFRLQAITARKFAILFGDAEEVALEGVGDEHAAHEDARRITAQEILDATQGARCPHCECAVTGTGCSNPFCEAVN